MVKSNFRQEKSRMILFNIEDKNKFNLHYLFVAIVVLTRLIAEYYHNLNVLFFFVTQHTNIYFFVKYFVNYRCLVRFIRVPIALMGTVARLAQSVEHQTLNLRVVGSSPTLGDLQHGRINVSVQIFFVDIGKIL